MSKNSAGSSTKSHTTRPRYTHAVFIMANTKPSVAVYASRGMESGGSYMLAGQ